MLLVVTMVAVLGLSVLGVGSVAAQSDDATGGERVVEGGETVFLDEGDIDTEAGIFENLNPGEFTDADGRTLSLSNGVVDPSNAASTYTATDPSTGETLSVDVRVARIQRVRPINPRSGVRLDFPGTPRVRPGERNLQFAVNYNYFESTEIDEELRQNGTEVTRIYIEESQDRANTGSSVTAADGTAYDAVFTFSIADTGVYEFVAEPLTGDDRPDGRDVGFDDRDESSARGSINVGFEETQDDEDGGDEGMEDEEDGNVTDGQDGEGETDGEEDGNVTDGQDGEGETDGEGDRMNGEGDGNVTDGEGDAGEMDGDENGRDGEEDEDVTDGEGGNGGGDGSEGLPGFTAVTALLALMTAIAVIVKRKTVQ